MGGRNKRRRGQHTAALCAAVMSAGRDLPVPELIRERIKRNRDREEEAEETERQTK